MTGTVTDFDLLEHPWIHATTLDGCPRELSLRAVFDDAPTLAALTGELPTQSFAILRLLLAVLRRAVQDMPGSTVQVWAKLWSEADRRSALAAIEAYLDRYRQRFRLFDTEVPFMQVAGLRSAGDAVSSLDKLIADVPNGEKYFTTRAGAGVDRIDAAEAARWLVHAQAFDPSGIKTGAVGDKRVKNNKGYPIGVAWTGGLGGVFLEGANLWETLLLNLVLSDPDGQRYPSEDLPVWERDPDGPAPRPQGRPSGPADLCTWQSRRVRLVHNGSHVTGVVLCNGDPLEPFNHHGIEPMTAWRYSEIQSKKAGHARHYPATHNPERTLWRGLASLLGEINPTPTSTVVPAVVEWARYLMDEDELDPIYPMRLHATGMQYINNQSVVGEIIDDTLGFRAAVLASDPRLRACALNAVAAAEDAVRAVAGLAADLARAGGGEPDGARGRVRERGYFALDAPYRRWLAELVPHENGYAAYDLAWQRTVRTVIEPLGNDLVTSAGQAAWIGREVNGEYLDSGRAEIWFRARLRQILPAAYPHPRTEGGSAA